MSMKLRHAAALALTFWLLVSPPIHEEKVDLSAPVKHWRLTGHVFDSLDDCQAYKAQIIAGSSLVGTGTFDKLFKAPLPEKLTTTVKQALSSSTCVSSDDPRLKETK